MQAHVAPLAPHPRSTTLALLSVPIISPNMLFSPFRFHGLFESRHGRFEVGQLLGTDLSGRLAYEDMEERVWEVPCVRTSSGSAFALHVFENITFVVSECFEQQRSDHRKREGSRR